MPRLRQARTKEEAAAVPQDQPIQVLLEEPDGTLSTESLEQTETKPAQTKTESPPEENEEVTALRKQVEAFKAAEKSQKDAVEAERQRAEEAQRRYHEAQTENTRHQEETLQARYDAVLTALEGARIESESAQQAIENAQINADVKATSEAYRRLARAEANMAKLEDSKLAIEERAKRAQEAPKEEGPSDPLERAIAGMPENVKTWVRRHPEYMTNQRLNVNMQKAHFDAVDEGHSFGSPGYMESVEIHLGLRQKPAPAATEEEDEEVRPVQAKRNVVTQAPPTREAPSPSTGKAPSSSKITLSPEEREVARLSGIDEVTYAQNKVKLAELKKNGHYNEGRG